VRTTNDLIALLKKAGCEDKIIDHSIAVRDLSVFFAKNAEANIELIETGALLHDIGRSRTHTIAHGQIGAQICRELGLSENICLIIERHIGAGLTADECRTYGLVPKDCIPETLEEKIVAHCDNLIKGTKEITIDERLRLSSDLSEDSKIRLKELAKEIEKYRHSK